MIDNKDILKKTIKLFGADNQLYMCVEECAELITAIHHYKRDKITPLRLMEEIADVQIMLNQLKMLFGESEINNIIKQKIQRLNRLCLKYENNML